MSENPYSAPKHDNYDVPINEMERLPHDIRLSGSMSIRDVLQTQSLILRHRWLYAVLTLGIYVAFVLVLGMFTPGDTLFGNTFMVLGLFVMPAILPLTLLMIFLRLRRDSKLKTGIFAITETRLSNEGIHTTMHANQVTISWTSFSRFLCSPYVVLLFLEGSNDHLIVARSKLVREDDWPVLLGFLSRRYPAGHAAG